MRFYRFSTQIWTNSTFTFLNAANSRTLHSAWLDETKANLLVWGGYCGYTRNDLIRYNFVSNSWTYNLPQIGTTPTPRQGHSVVRANNTHAYLFGGATISNVPLDDFYVIGFSGGIYTWTRINLNTTDKPSPRYLAPMGYLNGCVYLFGGMDPQSWMVFDDFWKFCGTNWTRITPLSTVMRRAGAQMITRDSRLMIWGGFTGISTAQYASDLVEYDPVSNNWNSISIFSNVPPARWRHSTTVVNDAIVVCGGNSGGMMETGCWATPYHTYYCPPGEFSANGSPICLDCPLGTFTNYTGAYECTKCAMGTYQNVTRQTECVPCPAGTYSHSVGAVSIDACLPCPTRQYAPMEGAVDCMDCPAGTWNDVTGQPVCTNCTAGTASTAVAALDASVCATCAIGSYSLAGASTCTLCPGSTYSLGAGLSSCTDCLPGQYSGVGALACTDCPQGRYGPLGVPLVDLASCPLCPAGTWGNAARITACVNCTAGYYSTAVGATASGVCTACAAGMYSPDAGASTAAACVNCPSGSFATLPGTSSCTLCLVGFYGTGAGKLDAASGCSACPPGTFGPSAGAGSIDGCQGCPVGTYSLGGQSACTACPEGTFSPTLNATSLATCLTCPPNTYSLDGAGACTDCPVGEYSYEGSSACTACTEAPGNECSCPNGYYADIVKDGSEECFICETGYYCRVSRRFRCTGQMFAFGGASECQPCLPGWICFNGTISPCPIGTYKASDTECLPCPAGYWCQDGRLSPCGYGRYSVEGQTRCLLCPQGTFSDTINATLCNLCPAGWTSNYARDHCVMCPAAEYSVEGGVCHGCPPGTFSELMGSATCAPCPAGSYSGMSSKKCKLCPADTYGPSTQAAWCVPCPLGTHAPVGSTDAAACV